MLPVALLLAATSVQAQLVTGEVVSAEDGRAIVGAFVVLLDGDGRRQAGIITGPAGRYAIRAPAPGSYTVRVEQIGFETAFSPVLELGAEASTYSFVLPTRAIALPGITVETASRCRSRNDGAAVHALWEEIRKALELTDFAQASGAYRFTVQQHLLEMDAPRRHVLREERTRRVLTGALPYVAAADAAELVRTGFLDESEGEVVLLGPDAAVLLSEDFAEGYCFRVVPGMADDEVGLGFEPVRRRGGGTALEGVLWVDRASAELRRLEFSYLGMPGHLAGHDARGLVHFTRLPTGAFIVREWWIHSPLIEFDAVARSTRAVGTRAEGGIVLAATTRGGTLYEPEAGAGVVAGTVRDTFHETMRPGIVVSLAGTRFSAVTDGAGSFRMEGVPAGTYAIAVHSDWMGELRTPSPVERIVVRPEAGPVRVHLRTPELAAAMGWRCPGTPPRTPPHRHGVVYGVALHPQTGAPLAGVPVRAEYGRVFHDEVTDDEGRFAFCWVPRDADLPVHIRINQRQFRTARVPLLLVGPILRHDFH